MKNWLFVATVFLSSTAPGQQRVDTLVYPTEKVIVQTDSSTTTMSTGQRYMYNRFWHNWFISAGTGGQVYFGDEDAIKPLGRRITMTYEASVGKWVHPAVALRGKIGGGLVKGYSTGKLPSIGHSLIVGTPDADGVYTQRWHQLYVEGNVMVDLCNAFGGYKPNRSYSAVVYVGVGMAYAQQQPEHDGDRTEMFPYGLINKFRVSDHFDANLEIKNAMVNQSYDREQSQKYYESFLAVTIGLTYNFGHRGNWFEKGGAAKTLVTKTYTHIPTIPPTPVAGRRDTLVKEEKETVREVTVEKKLVLTHPMAIFFELNKHEISDRAMVNLAFVADIIKSSGGAKFRLIGSADKSTASATYNKRLSEQRCEAVRNYLVNVLVVDPTQLILEPIGGIDRYQSARVNRAVIIQQDNVQ